MNEVGIPETWAVAKLGHLLTVRRGASPRPVGDPRYFTNNSNVGWLKISDLTRQGKYIVSTGEFLTEEGVRKSVFVPPGGIVLSNSATIGLPAITNVPICVHDGFLIFPNLPREIDIDYLYNFFLAFRATLQSRSIKGATQANLNIEIVSNIDFPLPPLGEQKRIVAKIESTFKKIDEIEKAAEKAEKLLKKYRESLLAKAFRGELLPQNPSDEPAAKLLERIRAERAKQRDSKKKKKIDLPPITEDEIPFEIPKSWEWVRLGEITSEIKDGDHHTPKRMPSGEMLLSAKNIRDGYIDYTNFDLISKSDYEKSRLRCEPRIGDLLMVSVGATIGRCAVVEQSANFSLVRSVALIRTPYVLPGLLYWIANAKFVQKQIAESKKSTGQPCLYLSAIANLVVPLIPMNEQKRILDRLSSSKSVVYELTSATSAIKDALATATTSILAKGFSGELVSQVPSEGTGHELLKLIKRSADS